MKTFVVFLFMLTVFETSAHVDCHGDIFCGYQSDEDDSNAVRRMRRDKVDDQQQTVESKKQEIQNNGIDLPPGYSAFEIPKIDMDPLSIHIHMNIVKVLDWDELNENIELAIRLKLVWVDFRLLQNNSNQINSTTPYDDLSYEEKEAKRRNFNNPGVLASLWIPNVFIEQLLDVKQPKIIAKPLAVRYIPELGRIEYTTRVHVKLDCSMDFQYYPADTQSCLASIRPYSYTNHLMKFTWKKRGVVFSDLDLSNYRARVDELTHKEMAASADEIYSGLEFKIFARRKLSYHMTQTYMASSFYILITTLCFLLPSTMVEARIGISMTTLLTLTAMFGAVRESTPIVSYTKAIDIWMIGCIFFVFLTLLQFTFHTWLKHVKKYKPKSDGVTLKGIKNEGYEMDNPSQEELEQDSVEPAFSPTTIRMFEKASHFLENYSFVLFLGIFFAFGTIYWWWLLSASNYFDWTVNSDWNRVKNF